MEREQKDANIAFDAKDLYIKQLGKILDSVSQNDAPRETVVWKAFCDHVDLQGAKSSKAHHTAAGMLTHIFTITSISETIRIRRNEDEEYDEAYDRIATITQGLTDVIKTERNVHAHDAPHKAYARLSDIKKTYKQKFNKNK